MLSTITILVEHGEDTDGLMQVISNAITVGAIPVMYPEKVYIKDWAVSVDVPAHFVLD